jgi:DNA polymerase-3 subunit delta'
MLFRDVIGQSAVKQHLIEMVQQNTVAHAQLFLSQPGAGALPLALAFTQYLVCENRQPDDSCGVCPACIKAQKLIHPDIHYTYPIIAKKPSPHPSLSVDYIQQWRKVITEQPYINELDWLQAIDAENKQGNISAEEARSIIRTMNLHPFEAPYKVQIIWKAEALSKEGNILLKLLEEPPSNTVLILIAENQEEILPTILSRCQLLKINKIDDDAMAQALLRYGVPQSRTQHIAYISDGNFEEAQRLMHSETHEEVTLMTTWLDSALNFKPGLLYRWTEENGKMGRENLKSFLEYAVHLFREALMGKYVAGYQPRLAEDERQLAVRLQRMLTYGKLEKVLQLISRKHYEIERNVSPKMVLMDMSLKMNCIMRTKD